MGRANARYSSTQDEVAILVHSEFGRRAPENTGLGTDHSTANVAFVLGCGVTGGQYGRPPSLTELVLGDNLQHTTDFRRVYATLIEEFLGLAKSETVLGSKFQTLGMLIFPNNRFRSTGLVS